jgi:hypothetical protein
MNSRLPGTPLRIGVEDARRLRLANAELEAARIALDGIVQPRRGMAPKSSRAGAEERQIGTDALVLKP